MPVITIRIGKGRSIETKRAAAQAITDAAVASLGVKSDAPAKLWAALTQPELMM